MLPSLKTAVTMLSLLQLVSARECHPQILKEVIFQIKQFSSGAQVPCNDTRVAQVAFTDQKVSQLSDQELLCQADLALSKVTRCQKTYEPLITNLKRLRGRKRCFPRHDNEIYLRHFLPALGNFTQGMYRRCSATQ